jgi:hypothetical protein
MIVCSTYWVPANNCMSFNCLIISVLLLKTPLSKEGGVISIYWFHPAIVLYFSCARRVWRYKRGNQNQYIEEEQTTQWPKDTKGVIRISISKKNRQHNGQKIPKGYSESVYQRRTDNTMAKRYQRGNQNPYIKEQTTQWPKEKVHKDKQRSIVENKRSSNTKPTKTAGKLRSSALNEVITSISVKHQTLLYEH